MRKEKVKKNKANSYRSELNMTFVLKTQRVINYKRTKDIIHVAVALPTA